MPKLVVIDRDRSCLIDLQDGEGIVIGRTADCDLRIEAPRASRRHCAIEPREGGGHTLRDLGSTNGTTLNGAAVTTPTPLGDGDVADVGGCRLTYRSRP